MNSVEIAIFIGGFMLFELVLGFIFVFLKLRKEKKAKNKSQKK